MMRNSSVIGKNKIKLEYILLSIILLLGFALRVYNLDYKSFWIDEIFTINRAKENIPSIMQLGVPPLHVVFVHMAMYLGESEFIIRFPSVISGVLGIFMTYKVGKLFFGRKEGLISAFLLSISVFHIRFSQDARYYPHVIFFSLLTLFFFYKAIKEDDNRYWIGFIFATALNIFNHFWAFFVLIIEIFFVGFLLLQNKFSIKKSERIDKRLFSKIALSLIAIFIIYLPRLLRTLSIIRYQLQPPEVTGESTVIVGLKPSFYFFEEIFSYFNFEYYGSFKWFGFYNDDFLPLIFIIFLYGLFSIKNYRKTILISLWITVPFIILFTLMMRHFFAYKYVIFILPIYIIVISKGITSIVNDLLTNRITRSIYPFKLLLKLENKCLVTLIVVLVFGSLSALPIQGYYGSENPNYRDVANFLKSNAQPGDLIIFFTRTYPIIGFEYYYNSSLEKTTVKWIPFNDTKELVTNSDVRVWLVSHRLIRTREPKVYYEWARKDAIMREAPRKWGGMEVYLLKDSSINQINGDFEIEDPNDPKSLAGWVFEDIVGSTIKRRSSIEFYSGSKSVKIESLENNNAGMVISNSDGRLDIPKDEDEDNRPEYFSIKPNVDYILEAYLKQNIVSGSGSRLGILWYTEDYNLIKNDYSDFDADTHDWEIKALAKKSPPNAAKARILYELGGIATGWVDHVSFKTDVNLLANGGFEKDVDQDGVPDGWWEMPSRKPERKDWRLIYDNISYDGTKSYKVYTEPYVIDRFPIKISPNTTYEYSYYTKLDSGNTARILLKFFKSEAMPTYFWKPAYDYEIDEIQTLADPTSWGKVKKVFTTQPDDQWVWIGLRGSMCNPPDSYIQIDNVTLRRYNPQNEGNQPLGGGFKNYTYYVKTLDVDIQPYVYNGGFEKDVDQDGVPDGWREMPSRKPERKDWRPIYDDKGYDGTRSYKVFTEPNVISWCPIKISPNTTYEYSYYTKLQYHSISKWKNNARILLRFFKSEARPTYFWEPAYDYEIDEEQTLVDPTSWTKVKKVFTTQPDDRWVWIGLRGSWKNPSESYTWIDNIALRKVVPKEVQIAARHDESMELDTGAVEDRLKINDSTSSEYYIPPPDKEKDNKTFKGVAEQIEELLQPTR